MSNSINPLKILVSPLNWGLGHASRCIPIINELLRFKFEVHIVAEDLALELLKLEFPKLQFHQVSSFSIKYSKKGNQTLRVGSSFFKAFTSIKKEKKLFQELHRKYKFDGIISDNRPGAFISGIPSVYITHQTHLKVGMFSLAADELHKKLYKNFTEVWIPDQKQNSLAGDLSKSNSSNHKYIGWLSRAQKTEASVKYKVAVILSGPEPQRSLLEAKVVEQLNTLTGNFILVRGTRLPLKAEVNKNGTTIDLTSSKELDSIVAKSKTVVARTGYSTLMDLQNWQKPALLIPTPGQPEQEYLGKYLSKNFGMLVLTQKELSLKIGLDSAKALKIKSDKKNWENIFQVFLKKTI